MGHDETAKAHLEKAAEDGEGPWFHLGSAAVYALLHLSDTIGHNIRDIVYELRS